MATIEVERQLLPILDSPNQGARFYNPELPRASRSSPAIAPVPAAGRPSSTG
jgi:hypothetical protein